MLTTYHVDMLISMDVLFSAQVMGISLTRETEVIYNCTMFTCGTNAFELLVDMFAYMCAHDLPRRYGGTFKLPAGLRFLFKSKNQSEDTMIVRDCYERVIQLLDRQLSEQERGSGVIFSGAQGNGKVGLSILH